MKKIIAIVLCALSISVCADQNVNDGEHALTEGIVQCATIDARCKGDFGGAGDFGKVDISLISQAYHKSPVAVDFKFDGVVGFVGQYDAFTPFSITNVFAQTVAKYPKSRVAQICFRQEEASDKPVYFSVYVEGKKCENDIIIPPSP